MNDRFVQVFRINIASICFAPLFRLNYSNAVENCESILILAILVWIILPFCINSITILFKFYKISHQSIQKVVKPQ